MGKAVSPGIMLKAAAVLKRMQSYCCRYEALYYQHHQIVTIALRAFVYNIAHVKMQQMLESNISLNIAKGICHQLAGSSR